jgi:4-alpha-glucanotransferase
MKRASGILMPVFSLPSPYGIGTFGKAAYDWVDFLAKAKQAYWQVLPLGPTSYGDSPYQSFSAFAGNPYFIDPDLLVAAGLLTKQECVAAACGSDTKVDYAALYKTRFTLLQQAFARFTDDDALDAFWRRHKSWLDDYALYTAIKAANGQHSWTEWPDDVRLRKPSALAKARRTLLREQRFCVFLQYLFFTQWDALKAYAAAKGVRIIGDMPIYVAMDSADVWANSEIFQLDENKQPTEVSGCPPDGFSADGQLWGNPLYRWDVLAQNGYDWWMHRLAASFELFDTVRIDHFRGLESYYAIPHGAPNARNGRWRKGPGLDFIRAMRKQFRGRQIIAEDLGFLTPSVRQLLYRSGYPGMKVLQFAFDTREESDYLPHNYQKNCVVYTGTHDNDTMLGWLQTARRTDVRFARRYLDIHHRDDEQWAFIRAAIASVANLAVIPMQDYLGLGGEARINTPSTLGGNWVWRMAPGSASDTLAARIAGLCSLFGRAPKP